LAPPSTRNVAARRALLLAGVLVILPFVASRLVAQAAYTLYTREGRRAIPVRSSGNTEIVALEPLSALFGLSITEDLAVGGLLIATRGQRIIALPGQSFVRVGERVVSLSGPIQRERNAWWVPIDFLSSALGPAVGQRVEIRRPSRLILVGDVRVPRVSGQVDRVATGARLTIDTQPAASHRVTRDGSRLTIRFDAAALDASAIASAAPEFAKAVRIDGPSVIVDLGPSTVQYRADADARAGRVQIDLLAAAPPPPKPAPPAPPPPPAASPPSGPPPAASLAGPAGPPPPPGASGLRTVVIDPGHGGDDIGATGPGGAREKDLTLALARRLKGAIEGRLGLRVLLTRDGDEAVSIDQRTSLANNNKADMFISLHVNGSPRASAQGAQVLSLAVDDYASEGQPVNRGVEVPVIGNMMRLIAAVPWDLAQIPFAPRSAALAALVVDSFRTQQVPLHTVPAAQAPLRVLVGANMPAILVELGFLTNADEERALDSADRQTAIVEALFDAVSRVRRGLPAPPTLPDGK
jgi:N-acetylmuramoyl-L-alanine amidase